VFYVSFHFLYCVSLVSFIFYVPFGFLFYFVSSNGGTPDRAALRWACGSGLGGMDGSALFDDFIFP
jgi:hypothetical protein